MWAGNEASIPLHTTAKYGNKSGLEMIVVVGCVT